MNIIWKIISICLSITQPSDTLKQARLEREQRRQDIDQQIKHNYQRVENSFAVKEEEIAELYTDLQFKLNIPK